MTDPIAGEGSADGFDPAAAVRAALDPLGPAGAQTVLVFTGHKGRALDAAREAQRNAPGATVVAVECAGVLTSRGEHEGAGTAAFAWARRDGLEARVTVLPADPTAAREPVAQAGQGAVLGALILTPPLYQPAVVASAGEHGPLVGGGASRVAVLRPEGGEPELVPGVHVGLRGDGLRAVAVSSPALRLVTAWRPLTDVHGAYLVAAGGGSMLEWLSGTAGLQGSDSPTFVAVRARDPQDAPLIRTVSDVDPRTGAVIVTEPIAQGREVALGLWDNDSARRDLAARVETLVAAGAGAVPVAGMMMTCLGRGADLFGARDVDSGALASRFPGVPFAGMFSQFEIARFDGAPRIHLYTASIAVVFRTN